MTQALGGMRAFYVVAFGQFISIVGTTMTQFGLGIWSWKFVTEIQPVADPATAIALVAFFNLAPEVLLGPITGALVDRWNRKMVMILADLAAGLATIAIFMLYASGELQMWHLYVAGAWTGAFKSFQWPAFSAAISTMIPKEQYTRANAILGLTESLSGVMAPPLAGLLLAGIGLVGIMAIDIVTFVAAVGGVLLVAIPQPPQSEAGRSGQGSLWKESLYGFRYIWGRPSLFGLQLVFFGGNLLLSLALTLLNPMILSRTGNNELHLSWVLTSFGVGAVAGGFLLAAWGGPKRKIHGVLLGWFVTSLTTAIMGLSPSLIVWLVMGFVGSVWNVFINSSNQAIWQAKVAPDVQGRVFSARRLIAQVIGPLGVLLAGPLADRVFEPAMMEGGSLSGALGWLVGTGPGAGMGLLFGICGGLAAIVGLSGYLFPAVRNVETLLPDHDAEGK